MPKYAGIRNGKICIVSDHPLTSDNYKIIELPKELENVKITDLIVNYKYKNNLFKHKLHKQKAENLKIAFVSNWAMECGLASYAKSLFSHLTKLVGDYKLFIEKNDNPVEDIHTLYNHTIPDDKIISCWKRGEPLTNLVKEIKSYDPDIILINHEFGIFPNARYWISMMMQLSEYRVITTMHSVFHHKDKTIVEAAIPEIIVHLEGAKDVLKKEKGIPGNVYVIPHGCDPCEDKGKLWNFYKSNHTVVQSGYGYTYKAYDKSIKTISLLKEKYPDIYFTGLFSETKNNKKEHDNVYDGLVKLTEELDIQDNIGIIRGYQSDETLNSYLRTNAVALFPYVSSPGHEVWGASGAARLAMTKNIPVITSRINHFSDLPTIKADNPEQMTIEIDKLFSNKEEIQKQLEIQQKYLEENSWTKIAQMYIDVFES